MKAVILYDSRTKSGSTEAIIDTMGLKLAESGVYVEKAKCKALADYSFLRDFDLVILGAPVYYFLVSSQLLGALNYGNLKQNLLRKKVALFLICGSPESMATVLYLPQLKIHLVRNKILVEKIFPSNVLSENIVIDSFVLDVLHEYNKTLKSRFLLAKWTVEAQEWLDSVPSFLQGKIKEGAEKYAEAMGYKEITCEMLESAKGEFGG
ncbi:MAG: protochlorophyllide oxidoreductase [Chlorobiaceae bacterium]|nr:protochlorophyllide oxidoreductase [Chlorobiaceae bacterium]